MADRDRDEDGRSENQSGPQVANLKSSFGPVDQQRYRDQPYPPGWIPKRRNT